MLVYLAGQINGLTYDEATRWRSETKKALGDQGIKCLDPMRGKESTKQLTNLCPENYGEEIETSPKFIMRRDHMDVMSCDIVLVNLDNRKRELIGTLMELAWAYDYHKPVIAICQEDDSYYRHPFVLECIMARVSTLEQAIDLVIKMRG